MTRAISAAEHVRHRLAPIDVGLVAGERDREEHAQHGRAEVGVARALEVVLPDGQGRQDADAEEPGRERVRGQGRERPGPDVDGGVGGYELDGADGEHRYRDRSEGDLQDRRKRRSLRGVLALHPELNDDEDRQPDGDHEVDDEPGPGGEGRQEVGALEVEEVRVQEGGQQLDPGNDEDAEGHGSHLHPGLCSRGGEEQDEAGVEEGAVDGGGDRGGDRPGEEVLGALGEDEELRAAEEHEDAADEEEKAEGLDGPADLILGGCGRHRGGFCRGSGHKGADLPGGDLFHRVWVERPTPRRFGRGAGFLGVLWRRRVSQRRCSCSSSRRRPGRRRPRCDCRP